MKVTQEMIENEVSKQLLNGLSPKIVLLDQKSFQDFNNEMLSKERFTAAYAQELNSPPPKIRLMRFTPHSAMLRILEVVTDEDLFEVV